MPQLSADVGMPGFCTIVAKVRVSAFAPLPTTRTPVRLAIATPMKRSADRRDVTSARRSAARPTKSDEGLNLR
jgi:hypothetical protein